MDKNNLKENRIYKNPYFPFSIHNNSNDNLLFDCHWHDELEIIYIKKGSVIVNINSIQIIANEGTAVIANSDALHSAVSFENSQCQLCCIVFDYRMLKGDMFDHCYQKFIEPLLTGHSKLPIHIKQDSDWGKKALGYIITLINLYSELTEGFEIGIKACIYGFLHEIIRNNQFEKSSIEDFKTKQQRVEEIKKALNYIHDNYMKQLSVKEISAHINRSEYHFYRIFKEITDRTPVEYITYYRVQMAAKLLKTTSDDIFNICMDVGFNNYSYFIKIFKKYKNCTPFAFRKSRWESSSF